MDSIGGYFSLELSGGEHFHKDALRLNSARCCFEYVLRARGYKKVYMPYYTCDVMMEPIRKLGVKVKYYDVNERLEPSYEVALKSSEEAFLYTNYFGYKRSCVERLASLYGNRLIVDNAQAFYAEPLNGIDTFYSPRKFFGVADGGYLYTDCQMDESFPRDVSLGRMSHLLTRADISAEEGYAEFCADDKSLEGEPIKRMSKLTEGILAGVDYEGARMVRLLNYGFLSSELDGANKLILEPLREGDVPMAYPFVCDDESLKMRLIKEKIYVATYWPGNKCEMTARIVPLPLDQRYGFKEMERILWVINK